MPFSHINWEDEHLHGFFKLWRLLGLREVQEKLDEQGVINNMQDLYSSFDELFEYHEFSLLSQMFVLLDEYRKSEHFYDGHQQLIQVINNTDVLQRLVGSCIPSIPNNFLYNIVKKAYGALLKKYPIMPEYNNDINLWIIDLLFSKIYLNIQEISFLERSNFSALGGENDNEPPMRNLDIENINVYSSGYGLHNLGIYYANCMKFIFNSSCIADVANEKEKEIWLKELYVFSIIASFYLSNFCLDDDGYYDKALNKFRTQERWAANDYYEMMVEGKESIYSILNDNEDALQNFIDNQLNDNAIGQLCGFFNSEQNGLSKKIIKFWYNTVSRADNNHFPSGHVKKAVRTKYQTYRFDNACRNKKIVLPDQSVNHNYFTTLLLYSLVSFNDIVYVFFRPPIAVRQSLKVKQVPPEQDLGNYHDMVLGEEQKKDVLVVQAFAINKFRILCDSVIKGEV